MIHFHHFPVTNENSVVVVLVGLNDVSLQCLNHSLFSIHYKITHCGENCEIFLDAHVQINEIIFVLFFYLFMYSKEKCAFGKYNNLLQSSYLVCNEFESTDQHSLKLRSHYMLPNPELSCLFELLPLHIEQLRIRMGKQNYFH